MYCSLLHEKQILTLKKKWRRRLGKDSRLIPISVNGKYQFLCILPFVSNISTQKLNQKIEKQQDSIFPPLCILIKYFKFASDITAMISLVFKCFSSTKLLGNVHTITN